MADTINSSKKNSDSNKLMAIVLAAGRSTRMGGTIPKVLHQAPNGSLLHLVLDTISKLNLEHIVVVTGFGKEKVDLSIKDWANQNKDLFPIKSVFQEKQLGTGDAVKAALPHIASFTGEVLIVCGDTPLLRDETLNKMLISHLQEKATLSVLTVLHPEAGSLGRIIRDPKSGQMLGIKEAKDLSPLEARIPEVNSGVYIVDSAFLSSAVNRLNNKNAQGEYYLTDIVELAVSEGQIVNGFIGSNYEEISGINTPRELLIVNNIINRKIVEQHITNGVVFTDPYSVTIDQSAIIGANTTIGPSTVIGKGVAIGSNVTIEGLCFIKDSIIGDGVTLKWGLKIDGAKVGNDSAIGPFAHLRNGTDLKEEVKIGNFVETKNAVLSQGAKASHLTYLGDCNVGKDANIGAGTITCNYDGVNKYKTEIGDGAFIGSNSSLIAPVKIGSGATIAAGSAISKDVSDNTLGITRPEQREIKDWKSKRAANK